MSIKELTDLAEVILWPLVVLTGIVVLRKQLNDMFGRIREIEAPGSIKVTLDPTKIAQIINDGRNQNTPSNELAQQIVKSALILEKREERILRALLDDDGRSIYSYQGAYYRPALDALLKKDLVQVHDRGYALTSKGRKEAKSYITRVIDTLPA